MSDLQAFDGGPDGLGDLRGPGLIGIRKESHELLSSMARRQIRRALQLRAQTLRHRAHLPLLREFAGQPRNLPGKLLPAQIGRS